MPRTFEGSAQEVHFETEFHEMKYRIDLNFIGCGNAGAAYGGFLHAWSFLDINPHDWFEEFRQTALNAMGQRFLPVYRMADGEYRFLMGRRYNLSRRPLLKELVAVTAEKIGLRNPDKWKTSWGETYNPKDTRGLREKLIENIRNLAQIGFLACYLNDNGLNAFTEHNSPLLSFFQRHNIPFGAENYVPFHFCPSLLVSEGWRDFIENRAILIVTGLTPGKEYAIQETLKEMGAREVRFLPISKHSSMYDRLDLYSIDRTFDICLVAAGIGSANILNQLHPLATLSLDIGGLMDCFVDRKATQHGGVIRLPKWKHE